MRLNVVIRSCRLDECADILNMWKEAEVSPGVDEDIEELRRLVRENGELFLVAEYDGRAVGTVIGGWDGWWGNIYHLAVSPEYRRQGIGQALVHEVERRLVDLGAKRISVLVQYEDSQAVSFWYSLRDKEYEQGARMIRYVKTL